MESQNIKCCCEYKEDKCCKKRSCLEIIATILLTAFSGVLGLVIGASVASTILAALSAIIVLTVILGLLLLLTVIIMICNKIKCKKYL